MAGRRTKTSPAGAAAGASRSGGRAGGSPPLALTHAAPTAQQAAARRRRAGGIIRTLRRLYPQTGTALRYTTPFELYVATVLSAQCTDEMVNRVTPKLFARYPTPGALARARRTSIEALIRPTGFFRNKAKSIQEGARRVVAAFGGELPGTMEELLTLAGTGRKTANVILGNVFGLPGITVDTHVRRLSQRLGLTTQQDPVKIEFELMEIIPQREWTDLSHRLIQHGRRVCAARKPRCGACALLPRCPFGTESEGGPRTTRRRGSAPRRPR